jgi:hypothetical protein
MDYAADLIDNSNKVEPIPLLLQVNELYQSLKNTALAFYISILDYFIKATEYDSILVSFLTVLSARDDKT